MHIGFLSFRIAGLDGVSLEADRWKTILERMGHRVTLIAGDLDRQGLLIPVINHNEPKAYKIQEQVIVEGVEFKKIKKRVLKIAGKIEEELRELFTKFHFDRLIVANAFSLPFHICLAVALDKIINDFKTPTISRNHDFWWERKRYLHPSWADFFERYFPPPQNPLITHVSLSSVAQKNFKKRTGQNSVVIGDSFDYQEEFYAANHYTAKWRQDFNLKQKEIVFLQATRIVPRKQIELSIELVKRLKDPRVVLVLAGHAGDEGKEYLGHLQYLAKKAEVRARFIGDQVGAHREIKNNLRVYNLWDCLYNCDLVTYPSTQEGFGNQFLEAVYFKKPIFVNRYDVYKADLEPLGFKTIAIDDKITEKTIRKVKQILKDPRRKKKMTEKNYQIAKENFSFKATQRKLSQLGF